MDADGQDQRRITGHQSISMSPAWRPPAATRWPTSPSSTVRRGSTWSSWRAAASGRWYNEGSLNTSPSFSPDGQQVAFARSVAGNIEIFVASIEGGNLRRLTTSPGIDTNPSWSPERRRDRVHLEPRRQPADLRHGRRRRQPAAHHLQRRLQRRRSLAPRRHPDRLRQPARQFVRHRCHRPGDLREPHHHQRRRAARSRRASRPTGGASRSPGRAAARPRSMSWGPTAAEPRQLTSTRQQHGTRLVDVSHSDAAVVERRVAHLL